MTVAFKANKNGTDQTGLSAATPTQVTLGTEVYDLGSNFASSAWTPPAGFVTLVANLGFKGTIAAQVACTGYIYKDGAEFFSTRQAAAGSAGLTSISVADQCTGSNVYTMYGAIAAGTSLAFYGNTYYTNFSGLWFPGSIPSFRAHKNGSNQTGVVSGALTQMTFGTEAYDNGGYFASNAWTPPAGIVSLSAGYRIIPSAGNLSASALNAIAIYKNGSILYQTNARQLSVTECFAATSVTDSANGTDSYTAYCVATHSTSANVTVDGATNYTFFSGRSLDAALGLHGLFNPPMRWNMQQQGGFLQG